MIHSMTGFGNAQLEDDRHAYHVEIRTVNNRYYKAAIHLPDRFSSLESDVDKLLRAKITRGSVVLRIHIKDLSAQAASDLNVEAIQRYVDQLRGVAAGNEQVQIDLATLALLPGVCQPTDLSEAEREAAWKSVSGLIHGALEQLLGMRAAEGEALAADLTAQCDQIRASLEVVRTRAPQVLREYHTRVTTRVNELLAATNVTIAGEELAREIAVYADRSDINEEISRLTGHLVQFDKFARSGDPVGRKLEFIAQEMLREANTMGSKTGDPEIAREIIEIKSAVDRLKEQVQNVE